MHRCVSFAVIVLALAAAVAAAQSPADRQRARIQAGLGWEYLSGEKWEAAAKAFQQAIDIDASFEDAFYGLGRARMASKQYLQAIAALGTCGNLYRARAGKQFTSQQEAQRYRNDRITEIDEAIRQVQSRPPNMQNQDLLRQLNNQRRDIQNAITKGSSMSIDGGVPPWVSLSLGSAYFRSGKLADAEREYKATVEMDPKSGEALSNLAVVYLETGRFTEADQSLQAAKRTGFRVNPQLEQDIRGKLRK